MFWTVCPYSLGSCNFQDVWANYFLHRGGSVPFSALPKNTTSELPGLFSTTSIKVEPQAGKLQIPFLKVFWYDSIRAMKPRSTNCKVDALTTTPWGQWRLESLSSCSVSRLALHRAAMPNIFLSLFFLFFVGLLFAA